MRGRGAGEGTAPRLRESSGGREAYCRYKKKLEGSKEVEDNDFE
mgnify:CR=1 FL=1